MLHHIISSFKGTSILLKMILVIQIVLMSAMPIVAVVLTIVELIKPGTMISLYISTIVYKQ